jgi:hypothetical protein
MPAPTINPHTRPWHGPMIEFAASVGHAVKGAWAVGSEANEAQIWLLVPF